MPNENATATTTTASERHQRGEAAFAAMISHWLASSSLSQERLELIADWAMGEEGFINKSNISRLKTQSLKYGPNWRHIDALAAANEAIWLWQSQGQAAALAKLGPASSYGIDAECLDDAVWLPSPDDAKRPLTLGQMAEVIVGRLELPYLATPGMSQSDARRISDRLAEILSQAVIGHKVKDGIELLINAYPTADKARQRRLKRLVLGDQRLSIEELEGELDAMATIVRTLRGLTVESYGAAELWAELVSDRPLHS